MLNVRGLAVGDLPSLYEFWYDLEVLRSRIFNIPLPVSDMLTWLSSHAKAQGYVAVDEGIVGALLYQQDGKAVTITDIVIDIHTASTQAIGAHLWRTAVRDWMASGTCTVEAQRRQWLPVEQAFWRACGANMNNGRVVAELC